MTGPIGPATRPSIDELFTSRLAVILPEVIDAASAATARAQLERAGYARYALIDRGSYEHCDAPPLHAVLDTVREAAGMATGRRLVLAEARALRLGPGDYLLAHHDRAHPEDLVEAVLELSTASVPGAEVHYRRNGAVFFRVPSAPGSLAIVERTAAVTCNHTYVSLGLRPTAPAVVRLMVRLRPS